MMGRYYYGNSGFTPAGVYTSPLHIIMIAITWILVVALLIVMIRFFWKKGNNVDKKK